MEDDVLADSDSETDVVAQKPKQSRRVRHGSPIVIKHERLKPKQEDEVDLVNRQPDGGYLLGVAGFGDAVVVPQMTVPMTEEEIEQDGEWEQL